MEGVEGQRFKARHIKKETKLNKATKSRRVGPIVALRCMTVER